MEALLRCSSLPFQFTDGEWIRMPSFSVCIWYRGIVVPQETSEFTIVVPLSMFEEGACWDIHVGAGYRLSQRQFEGCNRVGYHPVPTVIQAHFWETWVHLLFVKWSLIMNRTSDTEVQWATEEVMRSFIESETWDLDEMRLPISDT